MAWSEEDDAPRVRKPPPLEGRIRQFADANGEVVALADQINIAIGQIELDFDFGMRCKEGRQRRHDVERREGARAGDPQQAGGLGAAIRELELRSVNFGERRGKAAMEARPASVGLARRVVRRMSSTPMSRSTGSPIGNHAT